MSTKSILQEAAQDIRVEQQIKDMVKDMDEYSEDEPDTDVDENDQNEDLELARADNDDDELGEDLSTVKTTNRALKKLIQLVVRANLSSVKDYLRNQELDLSDGDQHGWNVLHWAASQGKLDMVKYFVAQDQVHVDAKEGTSGWTALHLATIAGRYAVIEFLVRQGATLTCLDQYEDRPIDCIPMTTTKLSKDQKQQLRELLDP